MIRRLLARLQRRRTPPLQTGGVVGPGAGTPVWIIHDTHGRTWCRHPDEAFWTRVLPLDEIEQEHGPMGGIRFEVPEVTPERFSDLLRAAIRDGWRPTT